MASKAQRCYTQSVNFSGEIHLSIRSNLLYISSAVLGTLFWMLSCGSSLHPDQLKVRVPKMFSGSMHVSTCVAGAPAEEVTLDEQGLGKTALCPAVNRTVEIEIIRTDRRYKLKSTEVRILRAGDGISTSIEAQLPQ
jgi:hypothetical protein